MADYSRLARLAALLATLCLVLVWMARPSVGAEINWVVTDVTGAASVTDAAGAVIEPGPDVSVPPGARIRTEGDGQLGLKRGKTSLSVKRESDIEIGEQTNRGRVTIIQRRGEVFLDVEPRRQQHFLIETPHLTGVVKGTQFTPVVAKSGSSVLVRTGAVEVKSLVAGQATLVGPSQRARVASDVTGRQWAQTGPGAVGNAGDGIGDSSVTGASMTDSGGSRVGRTGASSHGRSSSYDLWDLGEIGLTIAVALAAILGILITVSDAFAARFRRLFVGRSK